MKEKKVKLKNRWLKGVSLHAGSGGEGGEGIGILILLVVGYVLYFFWTA